MPPRRAALVATLPVFLLLLVMLAVRFLPGLSATPDSSPPSVVDTAPDTPQVPSLPADAATQAATEKVALAQLTAFQKGDYKAALAQASPSFRTSGITPQRFQEIIAAQYAPLTTGSPEFGAAWVGPDGMVSLPFTMRKKGRGPFAYEYLLSREGAEWVIRSCRATRGVPIASGGDKARKTP